MPTKKNHPAVGSKNLYGYGGLSVSFLAVVIMPTKKSSSGWFIFPNPKKKGSSGWFMVEPPPPLKKKKVVVASCPQINKNN